MRSKAIREEAEQLVRKHSADAYAVAGLAMWEAGQRRNARLETYFAKVSLDVARLLGREVDVTTAMRYKS
jgi:hypothetical protein